MDRDEFMELVYETFADEPDNVLANGIIEAADAYVEYEKAQLSQEGTTSDLVSRQQAIEALQKCRKHCIDPFDSYHIDIQDAEYQLSKLPTIQPQSTAGQPNDSARSTVQSTDLIDRQQAIEALDCINGVEEVLRSLPSAQPETKKGEWSDGYRWQRCSLCKQTGKKSWNYCPHCGAKMKGAEHETN